MLHQTKIEWTDYTVNFWEGCQKVGPGCDNCYAEARDVRFTGGSHWGAGAPRRKVKGGVAKLRKINREADAFFNEHGYRPRVFCSSLSDIYDNAVNHEWRVEAFDEMEAATNCRFQLLTKRVGNVEGLTPGSITRAWPSHIGLMITVVDQNEFDRDAPKLLALKARLGIPWVGISYEPALGPLNLRPSMGYARFLDWVVAGGESGSNARPAHPQWFRHLRDQCVETGVAFLFKQWGEWVSVSEVEGPGRHQKFSDGATVRRTGKKIAGRTLDGRTWDQFPSALLA